MPTLSVYFDNEKPDYFKVLTINFEDEKSYSYTDCHNEDEVLNKVKDFLSKNKVKDKSYTGDILFVSEAPNFFTPNKIYHVKDGIIKSNEGYSFPYCKNMPFESFEDTKKYFSAEGRENCYKSRYDKETYTIIEVVP